MVQTTSTMIFIGNLPIMDTDESNSATENAGAIAGTYADSEMQMVDITNYDEDGDGVIWSDELGSNDYVSYTLRDGSKVVTEQDAIIIYTARITEVDGTVHDVEVSVIQMPNGDTFVNDYGAQGTTDNLFIDSIELIAPTITGSAGRNTYATTSNTTICFLQGTLIATPQGNRRIETLRPGDSVTTLDHAAQKIIWRRRQSGWVEPGDNPIEIASGAMGCGLPQRCLRLSPQHRVLVKNQVTQRMFDTNEVLITAKNMLPLAGVSQSTEARNLTYWHILLERHEIVFAEGMPAETLWPGREAQKCMPDSVPLPDLQPAQAARLIPKGPQQKRLIERLVRNQHPVLKDFASGSALNAGIGALSRQNPLEAARFIQ